MPATLEIDREQVRMMVIQFGVRETARMMGLNENTVSAWSARFGWIAALQARPALPASMVQKPASGASKTPVDALTEKYKKDRVVTRLDLSAASRKAARRLAEKTPDELLSDGGTTLKTVAQAASLVHGWQEQSQARVVVCLQALEQSATTLDIEPCESGDVDMDPENY